MKTIRTLLLTSFAVTLGAAAANAASADISGTWKLAIGANTVCTLMLSTDGTATYTAVCTAGDRVARYNAAANRIELRTASGETVGILYANGDTYAGKRFSDGRTLILSR
ncbi:MAG: AprI/Inh family metalloprotease inhibitor [Alphaproteobacteria bacterium]|nr:AprI/Inh family metalloprotease inhibitor [Alphaproteobacteria bacterium]MDE2630531.1 AprI/Inh family metalloprotease inhibitor [Alphaproteobacteria bacterium]